MRGTIGHYYSNLCLTQVTQFAGSFAFLHAVLVRLHILLECAVYKKVMSLVHNDIWHLTRSIELNVEN